MTKIQKIKKLGVMTRHHTARSGFANVVLAVIIAVVALGGGVLARKYLGERSRSQKQQQQQAVLEEKSQLPILTNQRKCEEEKQSVIENLDFGKPAVLTGLVDFPNKNFSLSSFTVNAGIYDSSLVRSDGSFCLVNNEELKAVLVTVGKEDGVILMALATPRSDEKLFVVSPVSTAVTMIAFPSVVYLTPEINEAILNFVETSPRTKTFIDALSKELTDLLSTAEDSSSVLEKPYIEPLYNDAKKALEDKLKELTQ